MVAPRRSGSASRKAKQTARRTVASATKRRVTRSARPVVAKSAKKKPIATKKTTIAKAKKPVAVAKKAAPASAKKKAVGAPKPKTVPAAPVAKKTNPAPKPAVREYAARPPAPVPAPAPVVVQAPAPPPPPPVQVKPAPPPVRRPLVTLTLATRKSALAVAQAELVLERFAERIPNYGFRVLKLVTTGDRQMEWSLEQQGGKGLFTGELEAALSDHRADVAVHSAKDMPTEMPEGLNIAGYLPREDPRDMLVIREGVVRPATIATGSPRRRLQLERQFNKSAFVEIRGNVETRLRKIAEDGVADATVLAAAGLKRLGIREFPGLRFQTLPLAVSVPAVGQAAIAVQARGETANFLRAHLDEPTRTAVELERAFLRFMNGGCQTAFAVHYDGIGVHLFHESCGYQRFTVSPTEALEATQVAERVLTALKLRG